MPITVLDGTETFEATLAASMGSFSSGLNGTVGSGTTTIEGVLQISGGRFTTDFDAVVGDAPSSFDWTHGLGDLRVLASDVMSGRFGVGASVTKISSVAELEAYETYRPFFSTLGDYVTYNVNPSTDYAEDLFIDFREVNDRLPYGLHIGRWRHVILLGIEFDLVEQNLAWLTQYASDNGLAAPARGNGLFEAANKDYGGPSRTNFIPGRDLHEVNDQSYSGGNVYYNNPGSYPAAFDNDRLPEKGWNIHPRIAGACGIRLAHSGYCFIEGLRLNCNGQQGDGIIVTRESGQSTTDANANRRIYITNSRIEDYEGQSRHKNYGDGIHGDSLHSQNGAENSSYWENIYIRSWQEGNVHTGDLGSNFMRYHFSRNYQYVLNPPGTNFRNLNDYSPPGEKSNGAVISYKVINSSQGPGERDEGFRWYTENLWVSGKSTNILRFTNEALTTSSQYVNAGLSPIDFAPVARVGVNYNNSSPSESYYNSL